MPRVQLYNCEIKPGDFCMDFRSMRGGRPGLAGSRPYSNLGMPFRSNDFPSVQPKHGLQSLGKVGTGCCMPPPANLPSLKSENSGNNPNISLVPSGGSGWGSATKEKAKSTTEETNGGQQPSLQLQPASSLSQTTPKTSTTNTVSTFGTKKTWSSVTSIQEDGGQERNFLGQQLPFLPQEFPKLAGGDAPKEGNQKSSADAQYRPGPSLRPQNYVPEKKKKMMTLKSKRDKRRISPRRMLRSATKSSISRDGLYNRSRFNTDLSLSESDDASEDSEVDYEGKCLKLSCTSVPTGYASHNEALQDYVPEKKKKKMTVKSKRDKRRMSPRRMLRSVTKSSISRDALYNRSRFNADLSLSESDDASDESEAGQNLARSARNDRAGSSDFSIVRRHQKLSENRILGSNQAAQSGFSFGSAATFAMPAGGFVLEDCSLELTSDDHRLCLPEENTEEESSEDLIDEYDGFLEENPVTYSPTDPNYAVGATVSSSSDINEANFEDDYEGTCLKLSCTSVPTGYASHNEALQDYVPEKKKKKMTVKSKRDKRRMSPRRMLQSVTKSSISRDALYNRSRFNADLSLSESDDASDESEADYEGTCLKLSCTSVPTGYASHNEALQGCLELRSDDEYEPFLEDSVTYSPTNPNYAGCLELKSDDEYEPFLEDSVTYSPTNPNYAGTGFDLPQAAVKALQLTAQSQSSPMSGKPSVSVATKCFMLSNMFDPVKETNPTWDEDIKNDVIKECRNHGGALHVHVDKNSPDGNVYVKCPSLTVAAATVRVLHGRYFAGRVINVTYIPEANYQMLFPDSAAAVAVL